MPKGELSKIIRKYAKILRENRIAFSKIYLFGSQAEGRAHEFSDIDLAVVMTKTPRGMGRLERKMDLRKLTANVDLRIEPILLEESELTDEGETIMGGEVRRHGILVVSE